MAKTGLYVTPDCPFVTANCLNVSSDCTDVTPNCTLVAANALCLYPKMALFVFLYSRIAIILLLHINCMALLPYTPLHYTEHHPLPNS